MDDVYTVLGQDQRCTARLDYPAGISEIGAVARPHLRHQLRNLQSTPRLRRTVCNEHSTVLEQLRQRFTVSKHKRVLEQRLQVLWCARPASHIGEASSRLAAELFQKSGISGGQRIGVASARGLVR